MTTSCADIGEGADVEDDEQGSLRTRYVLGAEVMLAGRLPCRVGKVASRTKRS